MNRMHDGQALLLAGVDTLDADLARQDLEDAGIPTLIERAIGMPAHEGMGLCSVNLFVPASARERAREVLKNVGGPADPVPLVKSGALGTRAIDPPPSAPKPVPFSLLVWIAIIVFALFLAAALIVKYIHSD